MICKWMITCEGNIYIRIQYIHNYCSLNLFESWGINITFCQYIFIDILCASWIIVQLPFSFASFSARLIRLHHPRTVPADPYCDQHWSHSCSRQKSLDEFDALITNKEHTWYFSQFLYHESLALVDTAWVMHPISQGNSAGSKVKILYPQNPTSILYHRSPKQGWYQKPQTVSSNSATS